MPVLFSLTQELQYKGTMKGSRQGANTENAHKTRPVFPGPCARELVHLTVHSWAVHGATRLPAGKVRKLVLLKIN